MKIGDYVRTKYGYIRKIINEKYDDIYETDYYEQVLYPEDIKGTPSSNIIDLIEVGDYVNGMEITSVIPVDKCGDEVLDYQHIFAGSIEIFRDEIRSILTKEQYASMEYNV